VDCHARFYQLCLRILDPSAEEGAPGEEGALRYEWAVPADIPSLMDARDEVLARLAEHDLVVTPGELCYTCESSGPYHKPLLNAWGGRPAVVNPLLAGSTRRKTDALDARLLAYQAITGLWPATYVMPHEYEQGRHWIRAARHWEHTARLMRQKILTMTTLYGHTIGALGSVAAPAVRGVIEDLAHSRAAPHPRLHPAGVPVAIGALLLDWYRAHDDAEARAKGAWREAQRLVAAQRYVAPATGEVLGGAALVALLHTIPGVGDKAAYTLIAETGDIGRFPSAKAYAAYCGLDPSLKVSAGKVTSHTRRRGNAAIGLVMRHAASALLAHRTEAFGQWGYVLCRRARQGGWRKACAAIARRCVIAVFHCWTRGVAFSYAGYALDQFREIATEAVEDSGLSTRVRAVLVAAGYRTSTHVAAKLAEVYGLAGVGPKAREEIDAWLSSCREKSLAARAGKPSVAT
jgi:hypothetical protein